MEKALTFEQKIKLVPAAASLAVFVTTTIFLFIWLVLPSLKEFSSVTMKANTAMGLWFASLALWFFKDDSKSQSRARFQVGLIFTVPVLLIGALTSAEYIFSTNLGIDEFLVKDYFNQESSLYPGRMSPIASVCFILLGCSYLTLAISQKTARRWLSLSVFPLLTVSLLAVVGYLYGERSFYQLGPYIRIALPTALSFLVLSLGILFSRPKDGPARILASPGLAGMVARRLLPVVVLAPIILGFFWIEARRNEWVSRELGVSIFVIANISLLMLLVTLSAKRLDAAETERRATEEDLRRSEERLKTALAVTERARRGVENERENFRNLFKQTPEMVCILKGPDHVFEFVNEAHIRVLGFNATGLAVRVAQPESVEVHGILDEVYRTGKTAELHEIPVTVTHRLRYFNLTYAARRDEDGKINGIMILGVEITDQVLARESLRAKHVELQTAIRSRDEFLSIASHELKTPISSLKLQAQLAKRTRDRGDPNAYSPERVNKLIDQTDKQVERITRLVDDMLDVSRIQSGKMTIHKEPLELCDLAEEVIDRLSQNLTEAGTPANLDCVRPAVLEGDRQRIEQVVTNLLTNAMRYGNGQPIRVIVGTSQDDSSQVRICVEDQGRGIFPEMKERIFNRFERGINAAEVSGLGLGLYITRQIVEEHGGRIWVESEGLGKGSRFFVEFPGIQPHVPSLRIKDDKEGEKRGVSK